MRESYSAMNNLKLFLKKEVGCLRNRIKESNLNNFILISLGETQLNKLTSFDKIANKYVAKKKHRTSMTTKNITIAFKSLFLDNSYLRKELFTVACYKLI